MSNNHEFFLWQEHNGHNIGVTLYDGMVDVEPVVRIVCHDCKGTVEVWQYQKEYEDV